MRQSSFVVPDPNLSKKNHIQVYLLLSSKKIFRESSFCIQSSVADPPGSGAFLTPGSGRGKKSWSEAGIRIRDKQSESYFRELRNHFFGLEYGN
jgi:hypothetical protein